VPTRAGDAPRALAAERRLGLHDDGGLARRDAGPCGRGRTLLLRYLAAFGPATPPTHSTGPASPAWARSSSGSDLGSASSATKTTASSSTVPRAPLPDPDVPAPVRFLPEYDNVVIGHKDRTRIVPEGIPRFTQVGWGSVLVDGTVAARWRLVDANPGATLRIEPFRRLTREERADTREDLRDTAARSTVRSSTFRQICEGPEDRASLWCMSFGGSQDGAAEQHAIGFEHGGHVPDRAGFVRLGSAQAVEHVVERR